MGYTLGPGDEIEVSVYQEPELGGRILIDSSGRAALPLLGPVEVAGLSTEEVAAGLTELLSADYLRDPRVTVQVAAHRSKRVTLYGATRRSEVYLERDLVLLDEVLARAGADLSAAREVVVRRGESHQTISLERLIAAGEGNLELRGGDALHLRQAELVYVNGEVARPSALPFHAGLTVSQALTSAGGLTNLARARGAYILRGEERIAINLRRILDGRDRDMDLLTGDKVVVPESVF